MIKTHLYTIYNIHASTVIAIHHAWLIYTTLKDQKKLDKLCFYIRDGKLFLLIHI